MGKPWEYKWRIVGEPLGSGGQGATHLAESTEDSDTHAALKILKNRKSKQARLRMRAEVASLQVLSSAGGQVPAVIDHNTDAFEDTSVGMYVAMAYAPGRTLRAAVEEDGPYDYSAANRIIDQVCKTLELAHEYPILHRDLKPDNVIICDPDNTVVIVDYGLSFNDLVSNLTVTGETFRNSFLDLPETNTPGGDRRDARSDVTAACALYYFSLTGHSPGQLQDAQGRLPHRRPGYGLPDGEHRNQLEHLFDQGFAPEIGARFQTIADFQQRVHTVSKQLHSGEPDDPIKVAQEVSQLLEQRDRRTQLRGYEGAAATALGILMKTIAPYRKKLGGFQVTATNDTDLGKQLPDGIDRVVPHQLLIAVTAQHYKHARGYLYAVGSRGEQLVILRMNHSRGTKSSQFSPSGQYEELLWFSPGEPPLLKPVETDIQARISAGIREIGQDILADQQ